MATLTINGKRVKVDDSFLSLPPEQQNATVDEIAASLGAAPKGLTGTPGKMSPYQGGVSGNVQFAPGQEPRPSLGDEAMSFGRGMIEGIPIAGPIDRKSVV